MLRVLVVALVLLTAMTVWLSNFRQQPQPPAVATILPEPLELPSVRLTDQHGDDFVTSDLEGNFTFLFFGFTNCPDICPITLQTLAGVNADLQARGADTPEVLFVSVDPERDSPDQIQRYLGNFSPEFDGVTGDLEALQPLTSTLGVIVERHEHVDSEAYSVTHNSTLYLVGPESGLIAIFSAPHDASVIATDYLRVREIYQARRTNVATRL
jgi:protein SCO1/2